jgi:hypothetical protein
MKVNDYVIIQNSLGMKDKKIRKIQKIRKYKSDGGVYIYYVDGLWYFDYELKHIKKDENPEYFI